MAPKISIVVNVYNMVREAPRTLLSLSPSYQVGSCIDDYEVLVVENGSRHPLSRATRALFPSNFKYIYYKANSPSPVSAINHAATYAQGQYIGIMIDGARICSPGLLKYTNAAIQAFDQPTVSTLAWHIGPETQQNSVTRGYNKHEEDQLLQSIRWPRDGYQLFDVASLAMSSHTGWFGTLIESNCVFVPRQRFEVLRGLNRRFKSPGGGYANLDFYKRATHNCCTVVLLGEGTFHQVHDEAVTTSGHDEQLMQSMREEYETIVGRGFEPNAEPPEFIGHMPQSARSALATSLEHLCQPHATLGRQTMTPITRFPVQELHSA